MATHPENPAVPAGKELEVLLVSAGGKGPRLLARRLTLSGYQVDMVSTEAAALRAFHRRGGHGVCVLGPLVEPGAAGAIGRKLKGLDAALTVLAHPDALHGGAPPAGIELLAPFHLFSRAGIGALLRELLRRKPELRG